MHFDSELEPSAPVMGGSRWRRRYHDIVDACRQAGGFVLDTRSKPVAPVVPEPVAVLAPLIVSTPPAEARVGNEYTYQPRAHAADTTGFTWYFEKNAPGMTVDRHTGKVAWTPSEGGWVEVVLCARSLYGAASRQGWTICVRKAIAIRDAVPNPRYVAAALRKRHRGARPAVLFWRIGGRRTDLHDCAVAPPSGRPRLSLPLRE